MLIGTMTKDELVAVCGAWEEENALLRARIAKLEHDLFHSRYENDTLRAQNAKLENDLFYSVELE
jgi:hypothetical protein